DYDLVAQGHQHDVGLQGNHCLVSPFEVVFEGHLNLHSAEGDVSLEGDLRSRRVVATGLVHIGCDVHLHIEVQRYVLVGQERADPKIKRGERSEERGYRAEYTLYFHRLRWLILCLTPTTRPGDSFSKGF